MSTPLPSRDRDLHTVLRATEVHLRDRARLRAERGPDPAIPADADTDALRQELDAAAARDPEGAARLGVRLRAARAGLALQARAIPDDALEGLYDQVRAATGEASPWARARMSEAFLDAPLNLQRWRGAALAACAVLAVGAGLFAGGRLGFDDGAGARALERVDPRNRLLPRLDAVAYPAPQRGSAYGTFVSDPGADAPLPSASPFYLFVGDPRRGSDAQHRLDAVLRPLPVEAREEVGERN